MNGGLGAHKCFPCVNIQAKRNIQNVIRVLYFCAIFVEFSAEGRGHMSDNKLHLLDMIII